MDYNSVFKTRAQSYVNAIHKFPTALEEEFSNAVEMLDLHEGHTLLNVPCGGIYIGSCLPKSIVHHKLEINPYFAEIEGVKTCTLSSIPYASESIDRILTLACLHHTTDQERTEFYNECLRILKPGGKLVIGDVLAGSSQDRWLNEIIQIYNSGGHTGRFFTETDAISMTNVGFDVSTCIQTYTWNFTSEDNMVSFFKEFMNMDLATKDEVRDALYSVLNVQDCKVPWKLIYFICSKPNTLTSSS